MIDDGRRGQGSLGALALRAFGGAVTIWLIAPVLVVIPLAFAGQASFRFPPGSWSTRWFSNLLSDPEWRGALASSLKIAALVVALSLLLGVPAALGLDRGRWRGKLVFQGLILAPMIVPVVVVAVGVYAVFLDWRLIGKTPGFVLAHTALALPFVVVAVSTSLAGFDRRLELAAASLGAGPVTTFTRVTLPLIMPGVLAGAVFAFITSFDEVVTALFLSNPFLRTVPVKMYSTLEDVDPTIAAASTLILGLTTAAILVTYLAGRSGRRSSLRARSTSALSPTS